MKKFFLYFFLTTTFIFTSCEEVVNIDLDNAAPKLVIDAIIKWEKGTTGEIQNIQLSLRNLLGECIANYDISNERTQLNLSNLQNGVYYVSLLQNGEEQFIQKLVLIK